MRLAGKRFWTWLSIAVISFLAGKETTLYAQNTPNKENTTSIQKSGLKANQALKGTTLKQTGNKGMKINQTKNMKLQNPSGVKGSTFKQSGNSSIKQGIKGTSGTEFKQTGKTGMKFNQSSSFKVHNPGGVKQSTFKQSGNSSIKQGLKGTSGTSLKSTSRIKQNTPAGKELKQSGLKNTGTTGPH